MQLIDNVYRCLIMGEKRVIMKTNPDQKHLSVIELSEDTHIVVPDSALLPSSRFHHHQVLSSVSTQMKLSLFEPLKAVRVFFFLLVRVGDVGVDALPSAGASLLLSDALCAEVFLEAGKRRNVCTPGWLGIVPPRSCLLRGQSSWYLWVCWGVVLCVWTGGWVAGG